MSELSIKRNVFLSVAVQMISFFVSLVLNLFLPKYLNQYEYSLWQTFLLYVSFVPFFHLGFLDGLMLRYSQYDYESLNMPLMRSQLRIFIIIESIFSLIVLSLAFFYSGNIQLILCFIAVAVLTTNLFTYNSYLFQLTNRISKYAQFVLILRISLGLGVILVLFLGASHFYEICFVYFAAHMIAIIWGFANNNRLFNGNSVVVKKGWMEFRKNIFAGSQLLVANLSAMLLISGAKLVVQLHFDPIVFGQVAFSFNVSNLFLVFITAASIAIFPSLKRVDKSLIPGLYLKIRRSITPFLFVALIFYFPGCYILEWWLPDYHQSLCFLGILMPLVVFSSRVTLLTNNYLKAYRKEFVMLMINIVSVIFALSLFVLGAYVFDSVLFVLFSLLLVIILHSIVSEIVVMRLISQSLKINILIESILVFLYVLVVLKFNGFSIPV